MDNRTVDSGANQDLNGTAPPVARHAEAAPPDGAAMVTLIERSVVLLLVVGLLIGVAAVLRPFTTAILFGATLAIAVWPLRQAMIGWGLRRGLTAAILLLLALLVVVLPVLTLAPAMSEHLGAGIQRVQTYFATAPEHPAWFASVPLFGTRLERVWDEVARAGGNVRAVLEPYSATVQEVLLTAAQALADSVLMAGTGSPSATDDKRGQVRDVACGAASDLRIAPRGWISNSSRPCLRASSIVSNSAAAGAGTFSPSICARARIRSDRATMPTSLPSRRTGTRLMPLLCISVATSRASMVSGTLMQPGDLTALTLCRSAQTPSRKLCARWNPSASMSSHRACFSV